MVDLVGFTAGERSRALITAALGQDVDVLTALLTEASALDADAVAQVVMSLAMQSVRLVRTLAEVLERDAGMVLSTVFAESAARFSPEVV